MAKKDEFDIEKEVERLSRKSDINIKKSAHSFENRLLQLDKDIDRVLNEKILNFDTNKELLQDYIKIDYKNDTINRYREKLRKM